MMLEGWYFRCRGLGHLANDCPETHSLRVRAFREGFVSGTRFATTKPIGVVEE